jgi:DMSO/TMAO reductase YedYZ heme-binding membrane subunit
MRKRIVLWAGIILVVVGTVVASRFIWRDWFPNALAIGGFILVAGYVYGWYVDSYEFRTSRPKLDLIHLLAVGVIGFMSLLYIYLKSIGGDMPRWFILPYLVALAAISVTVLVRDVLELRPDGANGEHSRTS